MKKTTKVKASKKAKVEVQVPESPKVEESVPLRGGFRSTFYGGNVGWQKEIERLRLVVNVCEFATRIGSDDAVLKRLMESVDAEEKKVCDSRVRIPSDVTTRIASLRTGMDEEVIGSQGYVRALRKLASLSRFVEDEKVRVSLTKEIAGAKQAMATKE